VNDPNLSTEDKMKITQISEPQNKKIDQLLQQYYNENILPMRQPYFNGGSSGSRIRSRMRRDTTLADMKKNYYKYQTFGITNESPLPEELNGNWQYIFLL